MLYLRPLDSMVTRPLPCTQDASQPFWSPDSKSIAFASEGKLKRIEVAGGAIMSLADARTNAPGGSWSSDGVILFGNEAVDGIDRIAASGGMASAVTRIDRQAGYVRHMHPRFLPGR